VKKSSYLDRLNARVRPPDGSMWHIDRKPVAFELWIFKWVFLPIVVSAIVFALVSNHRNVRECQASCAAAGFESYIYAPRNRPIKCECVRPKTASSPQRRSRAKQSQVRARTSTDIETVLSPLEAAHCFPRKLHDYR
jgi:hypothetical protein